MRTQIIFGLIVFFLIAGCSQAASPNPERIHVTCESDDQCQTPGEYLIRSNCPFGSKCVLGSCAVVCPMYRHDSDYTLNISNQVACGKDADCKCEDYIAKDTKRCSCLDGNCFAVVR